MYLKRSCCGVETSHCQKCRTSLSRTTLRETGCWQAKSLSYCNRISAGKYLSSNVDIQQSMYSAHDDTAYEREEFLCNAGALGVSGSKICWCLSPFHDFSDRRLYGIAEQRHVPNLPCSNTSQAKCTKCLPRSTSQVLVTLPNRSNNARKKRESK